MAVFEYKGLTTDGKESSGIIDADNPKMARAKLKRSGIFPVSVLEGTRPTSSALPVSTVSRGISQILTERIRHQDVAIMTRQLATLIGAGLPLIESLNALVDQLERGGIEAGGGGGSRNCKGRRLSWGCLGPLSKGLFRALH